MRARLTGRGRTSVPIGVRDSLALCFGDTVDFVVEDGTARLVPVRGSIRALKSMLPEPAKALSLVEMDGTLAEAVAKT